MSAHQHTIREGLDAVRRINDERQRRALDLQRTVRYEQQAVAQRRHQIQEAEEQLRRWRLALSESDARLAEAERELAALAQEVSDAERVLTAERGPALVTSMASPRDRAAA
jgi:hypothetical protein